MHTTWNPTKIHRFLEVFPHMFRPALRLESQVHTVVTELGTSPATCDDVPPSPAGADRNFFDAAREVLDDPK